MISIRMELLEAAVAMSVQESRGDIKTRYVTTFFCTSSVIGNGVVLCAFDNRVLDEFREKIIFCKMLIETTWRRRTIEFTKI